MLILRCLKDKFIGSHTKNTEKDSKFVNKSNFDRAPMPPKKHKKTRKNVKNVSVELCFVVLHHQALNALSISDVVQPYRAFEMHEVGGKAQLREIMLSTTTRTRLKWFFLCGCIRRARGPRTSFENDCVLRIGSLITLNCSERGAFFFAALPKSAVQELVCRVPSD